MRDKVPKLSINIQIKRRIDKSLKNPSCVNLKEKKNFLQDTCLFKITSKLRTK